MDRFADTRGARISYYRRGPARPLRLFSSSTRSARRATCGCRRSPRSSARIRVIRYDARGHGVVVGRRTATTPSSNSGATRWRSSTRKARGRRTSAASRWAGSPRCGSGVNAPRPRHEPRARQHRGAHRHACSRGPTASRSCGSAACARVAEMAMPRWFSPGFRQRHAGRRRRGSSDGRGVPAGRVPGLLCGAAGRGSARRDLANRAVPCLRSPVPPMWRRRPKRFGSSTSASPARRCCTLDAAHLSNVEQAEAFTSAVMGFLGSCLTEVRDASRVRTYVESTRPTLGHLNFELTFGSTLRHRDVDRLAEPGHRRVPVVTRLHDQLVRTRRQLHVDDVLPVAEMHPRIGLRNDRAGRQAVGINAEMEVRGVRRALALLRISPGGTGAIVTISLPNTRCTGLFTVAPFFGSAKNTLPPPGAAAGVPAG